LKSLKKTLDIIELIAENGNLGIREISALVGYPSTTVHRIITTLAKQGYLRQNPKSRQYSLSTKFLELADSVQMQFDIVSIARPYLEKIGKDTGENVNLGVIDDTVVVYIDHIHSKKHALQAFTRLGARVPLYATGMGKIFLSLMTADELDAYFHKVKLERFTEKTIIDRKSLLKELACVREQGYAVDNEEKERGVRCVAAPVFDRKGLITAAVSVSGAVQWITPERIETISNLIISCSADISSELGYKGSKTG
jgi:IclR family transcriptional regulator, KDG regulon repressor